MRREYAVPPCGGLAVDVRAGEVLLVVNPEGGQVADFFAEVSGEADEFLSPGVTMDCNGSLVLRVGDRLYSNRYRPLFRLLRDDAGQNDLLFPACSREMYDFFYRNGEGHPNCLDNLNAALGRSRPLIQPVNLFMRTRVEADGRVVIEPPQAKPGDCVALEALVDVRAAVSACSVKESVTNGGRCAGLVLVVADRAESRL